MQGEGTGSIRSFIKIIRIKSMLAFFQEKEPFCWGKEAKGKAICCTYKQQVSKIKIIQAVLVRLQQSLYSEDQSFHQYTNSNTAYICFCSCRRMSLIWFKRYRICKCKL